MFLSALPQKPHLCIGPITVYESTPFSILDIKNLYNFFFAYFLDLKKNPHYSFHLHSSNCQGP